MLKLFQTLVIRYRQLLIVSLNLLLSSVSYLLALGLRFDFDFGTLVSLRRLGLPLALLLFFRAATYFALGLNQGYWRYASTKDLLDILKAHSLSSALFAASVLLLRVDNFPRSVLFMEFALSILLHGGSRFMVRIFCEKFLTDYAGIDGHVTRDVVVLGAGDSGHLLVKNLINNRRLSYRAVGILDDSERLQGMNVYGVPILGPLTDLSLILQKFPRVGAVVNAIPSLSAHRLQELTEVCAQHFVPFKRIQSFEEIAFAGAYEPQAPLSIESVLQRETDIRHEDEIRDAIKGKHVLVTGAGGSIGSELVRQIMPFEPSHLTLLDNSEYNLFKIEREISQYKNKSVIRAVLASIKDGQRLASVFEDEQPQIVFHTAAYKHVPLLEKNLYEAFQNNIVGTRNILDQCLDAGVLRFVLISSDKAVDPSSIMGCTKRISERLVQEYIQLASKSSGKSARLGTAVVRFGNVINSNGSVIPLFKEQILSGGPITVTHPDMERYFMSTREAVRLALTAGTLGEKGEIYILDMGKQIKLVDLAKKMLALYGRRDIPIVFSGIRPGEKLSEVLTSPGEKQVTTRFAKVSRIVSSTAARCSVRDWILKLEQNLSRMSDQDLGNTIRAFALDEAAAPVETGGTRAAP